jgi:hypothetical protein
MATSKKSTGKKLSDPMSSVAATPVSLSVRQVDGEVKKIRATYGLGLEKPLCDYDPDTQSWKMYGDISLWGDCPLLVNLPASGMTVNGVLYLQPAWEPIIGETVSSSSPTHSGNWPTPTASDHIERKSTQQTEGSMHSVNLPQAVQMWPTPRANQAMASLITPEIANNPNRQPNLETVVGRRMWPTPTTQEVEHPNLELTETRRRLSKDGKSSHSLNLADSVVLWPTPTASSWGSTGHRAMLDRNIANGTMTEQDKSAMTAGHGGRLNPMWVEWLMGFPSGWTDLKD